MTRLGSSARPAENGRCREARGRGSDARPERRSDREKKRKTCMLCEVCNVQLNSLAQAQIHYSGKSHRKRIKQMSSGKQSGKAGSPGQSSPLLASLPVPGRPLQPQLDLKHFFPFRLGCSSPVSLFPNFNAMDPVQKAVINHTFGVPQPLRKKQIISCNICHLRFNSTNQAEAHYKGHKHARKLKAMEAQKSKQRNLGASAGRERAPRDRERAKAGVPEASAPPMDGVRGTDQGVKPEPSRPKESSVALAPPGAPQGSPGELPGTAIEAGSRGPAGREGEPCAEADGEPGKKKHQQQQQQHLHCAVCKLTVNSTSQLEAHNSGSKHKLMLEGQSAQPRRRGKVAASRVARKPKRPSGKGAVRVLGKSFRCDLCEIDVNSETQLKQHMNSRRHKDRLAGKAPRSKFGAYGKGPQSSLLATKLALHKQLTKGLTASFLPSPLSPTALCTMAASPLALRHPAGAATLVQSPLLSPALFRPAPGPLRATHASVIFSPY